MLLCGLLLVFAGRDAEMAGKLVPNLTEVKPVQPKVAAADFPKLDAAMGFSFEPFFKKSRVYAAMQAVGDKKEPFRLVFAPALGGDLGVAIGPEERIAAIGWFPEGSEANLDSSWAKFLGQFLDKYAGRYQSSLERPIGEFRKSLELIQNGKPVADPAQKRLQTLLWQKISMEDIERNYLFLSDGIETGEKSPKAGWEEIEKRLRVLSEQIAPALEGMLEEKAIARYKKNLDDTRSILAQALAAYQRDNRGTAKRLLDEDLQDSCSKCHGWDGHSLRKPLQKAMRGLREELGIGDGFFELGFDVPVGVGMGEHKEKEFQEMATALRGALLLWNRSR